MTHHITSLVAGGLLAFTLVGAATAGPYEDGEAAYTRDDYAAAMRLLRSPVANKRADAQRWIGVECMLRGWAYSRTSARR